MYISFLPVRKTPKTSEEDRLELSKARARLMFFESGRQAMRVGLETLGFKENDVVLMPASVCSAVFDPFANLGVKLKLYGLNEKFRWNINEIKLSITPETRALYIVHYFGITEDLTELKLLCREHKLILIEDRALCGFDPCLKESDECGDLIIYSIWKFHPIADGAILKINGRSLPRDIWSDTRPLTTRVKRELKIILKYLLVRLGLSKAAFNKVTTIFSRGATETHDQELDHSIYKITNKSQKRFFREDLRFCKLKRISNFNELNDFCANNSISTLYGEVGNESIPYCFPIIVNSAEKLQMLMGKDGIETELSINLPCEDESLLVRSENTFEGVRELAGRVLSIPIHQDIDEARLNHIKKSLVFHLSSQLSDERS